MLIGIEGVDGSGTTTMARLAADHYGCGLLKFPNDGGATGPLIRGYLKKRWWIQQSGWFTPSLDGAMVHQCLQTVNRLELRSTLRAARRSRETHLILDRYWQSGQVYGQLDGLDKIWLERINRTEVQADLNILIDIAPAVAMERVARRSGGPERYEGSRPRTERIVDTYRALWARPPRDSGEWRRVWSESKGTTLSQIIFKIDEVLL